MSKIHVKTQAEIDQIFASMIDELLGDEDADTHLMNASLIALQLPPAIGMMLAFATAQIALALHERREQDDSADI